MGAAINASLAEMIRGKKVPKLSIHGIKMLEADIEVLVKRLGPWISSNMREKHLRKMFMEAQPMQLCNVVLLQDLQNVTSREVRTTKYANVEIANLIAFLEKY